MRRPSLFAWSLVTFAALILSGGTSAAAAEQNDDSPRRGMVFLTAEIDDPTSKAEIFDFVDSCRIDFVVFDFAWITNVWPRTRLPALRETCERLKRKGVRVAIMYRPRASSPNDAPIHFAQDKDGKVAKNHNHLCFAHDDSQAWGAQWGTRILKEVPSVDTIIIYNLLSICECPDCRGGKGAASTKKFIERCRSEWSKVRPGVQIGHVGVGDEYVESVDFFCPFVGVNRDGAQGSLPPFPNLRFEQYRAAHPGKWMAPLLKTCWVEATNNTTADVVQSLKDCKENKTGFLLWYYCWLFHSHDRPYNPKMIVDALGGDWRKLSKYYGNNDARERAATPAAANVENAAKAIAKFRANPDDNADVVAAGEAAVDDLMRILLNRSFSSRHRYMAANLLGMIKSKKAIRPLVQALGDQDMNVRRCSALALAAIGDPSVIPAIERLARSDPFNVRDANTGRIRYYVREDAMKALRTLAAGTTDVADADSHKEQEIFLKDASTPPPFKSPLKIRRLPWPFPGEMKDQNVYNNYQQPTDAYVHGGLDFMQPAGTEVRAVDGGYIAVISTNYPQWNTHYFFIVATRKGGNEGWCYVHLDRDTYTFKEGDKIVQGQLLAKVVDFSRPGIKGNNHHLHLHYVRFQKEADGRVSVESLLDPTLFFDWEDTVPPTIAAPLHFVRKGTLDEFPKDEDGVPLVSGEVEIIAGISDTAYEGQQCNWMAPIVTLEIKGKSGKPYRKLVLDQRGPVLEKEKRAAAVLYLTFKEAAEWRSNLPPSGGVHFTRVTSTDGDGVIEPSDKLQAWSTTDKAAGRPRFPNGEYTVTVRAWDIAGNEGTRTAKVRVVNKK
jgi:murein DD-endopeptidase MepM/ murein hydrolase activator NlpD